MRRRTVVMRFDAPADVNHQVHILASQLQVNVRDLLLDGIQLVLRYHDVSGIPQPPLRTPPAMEIEEEEVEMEEFTKEEASP
jgi:hypothetical protein